MSPSPGAWCSCSGKRTSTCWRSWHRALGSTNVLRGSRRWIQQILSFCFKPLEQWFNHLSMKASAFRSSKRWPLDVRLLQVIFRPCAKSWAQQRYSCRQMISPVLDVRSPSWPDHRISAATWLPPELIERRYSPGIVARGKPSMCFAMPLRSPPSASDKSHLQRRAQPARTAHLKVWRESESYWALRGLRLDSNSEVKVCDKAQRFW